MTIYSKTSLLRLAGTIWLGIGLFLLIRGVNMVLSDCVLTSIEDTSMSPLFHTLTQYTANRVEVSLSYIVLGVVLGMIKARTVLRRVVERNIARIEGLDHISSLTAVFCKRDYIVMMSMMTLGLLIRFLGIYDDIRGFILLTVGSALIQGSMLYFKARQIYCEHTHL